MYAWVAVKMAASSSPLSFSSSRRGEAHHECKSEDDDGCGCCAVAALGCCRVQAIPGTLVRGLRFGSVGVVGYESGRPVVRSMAHARARELMIDCHRGS